MSLGHAFGEGSDALLWYGVIVNGFHPVTKSEVSQPEQLRWPDILGWLPLQIAQVF